MSFYGNLRDTAVRLIGLYGKAAKIVRKTTSGPPHAPIVTEAETDCVFVEVGYSMTNRNASLIQVGDKVGIISTDQAVVPQLDDEIRIDSVRYAFVDLSPLNPGGTTLLYEFVARK